MLLPASLLAAILAPVPAPSPSPSPSPAAHSEYVEVTAKGLQEEKGDVPAMVTVVSGEEARALNADDLRSALAGVTGVDVAPGGDNGPAGAVPEFWGLREL